MRAYAEYTANHADLIEKLKSKDCNYEEMFTEGARELAVFGRNVISNPADQDDNYTIQVINGSIILCVVHLPSRLYPNSEEKRKVMAGRIVKCLEKLEKNKKTANTIVVGDFNTNPYEMPCVQANCFHGIPSYQEAKRGQRQWMDEDYKMFYNPMWNLLGDFRGIPGTYYYNGDGVETTYWHMLDQVIFRPEMYKGFKKESLKIVTSLKTISFLDDNKRPNKNISDHLPIVFEIEEVINGK